MNRTALILACTLLTACRVWAGSPALGGFDGADDTVSMGNVLAFGDADYTVTAWVYLSSKASICTIVGKGQNALGGAAAALEYALYYHTDDVFRFLISNQTTLQTLSASTFGSPAINTWYFLVGVHSATANTIYIYVNGALSDSAGTTVTPSGSTGGFNLGSYDTASAADRYLPGNIDDVRIYSRALTAPEIMAMYAAGHDRGNRLALAAEYLFAHTGKSTGQTVPNGTTILDTSGNGRNGTLADGADGSVTVTTCPYTRRAKGRR